jgi:hypothetical protein
MSDDPLQFLLARNNQPQPPVEKMPYSEHSKENWRHAMMIEFELVAGDRLAFPYTSLLSLSLNPSRGIIATFSTHIVTVTGIHLRSVFAAIQRHEVASLKAADPRPERLPKDQPTVFSIIAAERR